MIYIPNTEILLSDVIYKNCIIEITSRELKLDLVLLDVRDFDVILGMDWLTAYYVTFDCRNKKVVFNIPIEENFTS